MGHINFTDKSIKSWISRESKSRLYKVSEFADIIGGSTPSTKNENYWDGEKPWITPKDLSQHDFRYIEKGSRNISEAGLSSIGNKLIPTNSVLLTTRAPVGYLAIASNPVCTNQGFRSLVIKDGFDPLFIYYLLLANIDYLKSNANGSTFQELSGSVLKNLEFRIPSLETQKEIAHILGTLDDKIELNRRMNKTLEDIAQALFKHWFIDFEFPNEEGRPYKSSGGEMVDSELGQIPIGWRVGSLNEIASFLNGLALQKYPPNGTDDLPVIKISQLNSGNTYNADRANSSVPTEYRVDNGDVLFSWSGSIDIKLWGGAKGALNQHIFKVTSERFPKWFYYFWTKEHLSYFKEIAASKATTMGHIKREHLCRVKAVIPTRLCIKNLTKILDDILFDVEIKNRNASSLKLVQYWLFNTYFKEDHYE